MYRISELINRWAKFKLLPCFDRRIIWVGIIFYGTSKKTGLKWYIVSINFQEHAGAQILRIRFGFKYTIDYAMWTIKIRNVRTKIEVLEEEDDAKVRFFQLNNQTIVLVFIYFDEFGKCSKVSRTLKRCPTENFVFQSRTCHLLRWSEHNSYVHSHFRWKRSPEH